MSTEKIQIAIIEDEEEVGYELKELINETDDLYCQFIYRKPDDALTFLANRQIHIVIVDLDLKSNLNGIDVIKRLKTTFDQKFTEKSTPFQTKFLVNTISETRENVLEALKAGAVGYILKGDKRRNILECLRDVCEGGSPMSSRIAGLLIPIFEIQPDADVTFAELTPKQNEVLRLVAQGRTNKMIADHMKITPEVVKLHCNQIYQKLHVINRTEAAKVYLLKQQGG